MEQSQMRHLEMIQNVITRMNSNSFLLKGWSVTIFVGLFTFANTKNMDSSFIIIALVPSIIFMFLDTFFLRQERLFRHLYNDVRTNCKQNIDFSMDTKKYKTKENTRYWRVICSKTIWPCYLPIIAITLIIFFENPHITTQFAFLVKVFY